ncbi:hypothetical protein JNW90_23690 [Micromonospora sp. STR1s_5]|nr:hypothetical protein [Micromonospora sp. STR1s_5]
MPDHFFALAAAVFAGALDLLGAVGAGAAATFLAGFAAALFFVVAGLAEDFATDPFAGVTFSTTALAALDTFSASVFAALLARAGAFVAAFAMWFPSLFERTSFGRAAGSMLAHVLSVH